MVTSKAQQLKDMIKVRDIKIETQAKYREWDKKYIKNLEQQTWADCTEKAELKAIIKYLEQKIEKGNN